MSKKLNQANWVTLVAGAVAVGVVLWLLFGRSSSSGSSSGGMVMAMQAQGSQANQGAGFLGSAGAAALGYANSAPTGTVSGTASGPVLQPAQGTAAPVYTGPQPSDLAYQEYDKVLDYAPLYLMRSNEYLSQANPELAAWDSTHLLPNAALSNCRDGAITDGPTFNQLSVFSGNKLFEASMAERYFTEIPNKKILSLGDIRALPPIASSSATTSFWNQSSNGITDVTGGLTNYNSAFCSQNNYPGSQITLPISGNVPGNATQTSVASQ